MRQSASYVLLVSSLLLLVGCSTIGQASAPPPLIFPTTGQTTPAGPPPLSLYASINTTASPSQHALIAVDAASGHQRWQFDSKATLQSVPILADQTLYTSASDQTIYAISASDGTTRWTYKTNGVAAVEAVEGGTLYASLDPSSQARSLATSIYALNAADGTLRWQAPITGSVSAVIENSVYVSSTHGDLYALNTSDGSERWHFHTGAQTTIAQTASGIVYALASQPNLFPFTATFYALNTSDGSLKWRYPPATTSTVGVTPIAVENNLVYLISNDNGGFGLNAAYALNASDGTIRWHTEVSPNATVITAQLVDGALYLGANDSTVSALNASDGTIRWQKRLGSNGATIWLANQGVLYITRFNEGLTALNASDGTTRWHHPISEGFMVAPSLINGQLYGAYADPSNSSVQSYLFSINAKDGTLKWKYSIGQSVFSLPIVG